MTDLRARAAAVVLLVALSGCTTGRSGAGPFVWGRFGLGRRAPATATDTIYAPVTVPAVTLPPRQDPEPPPVASDSAGIARVAQLARVWQLLALHHPWVAARGIPLDSAFVHAATLVRRANDRDTLELAYRRFLTVLDDPLTVVESEDNQRSRVDVDDEPARLSVETTRDSVLVLRMPLAARYGDQADVLLRGVVRTLSSSPRARVILDLRASTPVAPDSLDALLTQVGLVEHLSATPTVTSTVRIRRVGGARAVPGGMTDDDGWLVQDGALLSAKRTRPAQMAVIINAHTALPPRILGLLSNSGATLVAEGAASDGPLVPSMRVPIGAGLAVQVRTGELSHPDGRVGLVPDTIVPAPAAAVDVSPVDSSPALRAALQRVRGVARARPSRFVARGPAVLPAAFDSSAYPVMGARLLAGVRVWHLMRERHAHRELYDEDIDERLLQAIPALERARNATEYARALERLISAFDDGQVTVRGASIDTLRGVASLPFRVRWVDGHAVLTEVIRDSVTRALGIEVGQELTAIDGFPLPAWLSEQRRTVSATNEWTRTQLLMDRMIHGPRGGALVRLRDSGGRERQLTIPRATTYPPLLSRVERSTAPTSRLLAGDVLYLDVNRLNPQTIDAELARLRQARAAIFDLRGVMAGEPALSMTMSIDGTNDLMAERLSAQLLAAVRRYPVSVVAQELHRYRTTPCLASTLREATQQCSEERVVRARVTRGDTTRTFRGPIVALIDERTRGSMERLAAALGTAGEVTFIGSATAGAPADVTTRSLPGGLSITVPLVELRRADGAQWQRLGIIPTVDSRLTLRTIRSGADDVIERAQQWIRRRLDGDARRR